MSALSLNGAAIVHMVLPIIGSKTISRKQRIVNDLVLKYQGNIASNTNLYALVFGVHEKG